MKPLTQLASRRKSTFAVLALATWMLVFASHSPSLSAENDGIAWTIWTEDIFERAKAQKKLVILDLEAVWCHWCHVMDEKTYSRKDVQKLIAEHYIAVRVDQDSRPDLSNRYRRYGWPATIFFASDGTELAKRAGFIEPDEMERLLLKLVAKPEPEDEDALSISPTPTADSSSLSADLQKELEERFERAWDRKMGGLTMAQKYLEGDTVEYAIALRGDLQPAELDALRKTLDNNLKLSDPVWGGFYQYSTHYDWDHPHFEKIMSTQSRNAELYALAFAAFGDRSYLEAAIKVREYVQTFLTGPNGGFYTSQDADVIKGEHSADYFRLGDKERRKVGIPAIDRHQYARENGMMIRSLVSLYMFGADAPALSAAKAAAGWVLENRGLEGAKGGFRHDQKDSAGPYLGDTLEMGRAFLALYGATGDRRWLGLAEDSAAFIGKTFVKEGKDGFFTSAVGAVTALEPVRVTSENISATRFFNLLYHNTGSKALRSLAETGMRYLARRDVALGTFTEPGVLLADAELGRDPLHVTIVAHKDDPAAGALFAAALAYPEIYKRSEWWDKREGPMPNPDVQYPQLDKAAAFICTNKRCSLPILSPDRIRETIELFEKKNSRI